MWVVFVLLYYIVVWGRIGDGVGHLGRLKVVQWEVPLCGLNNVLSCYW